ncbi:MAG: ankyrin repeat domain-containing protein [Campylobacterota bacterium]|nr:ankyrin repeat domain-containing protein [Campylobacterota bacterium]
MSKWLQLIQDDDYLRIKKYISDGANINECNEEEESILAQALKHRCSQETIELIVSSGADIYEINAEGVSVFDYAISANSNYMFDYILDKGIDVNFTHRPSGFTPLMGAVCFGRVEMLNKLIDAGANIEKMDNRGLSLYDYARKMGKKKIIEVLENKLNEKSQ